MNKHQHLRQVSKLPFFIVTKNRLMAVITAVIASEAKQSHRKRDCRGPITCLAMTR